MKNKKLISIIIPVLNEEDNIFRTYKVLKDLLKTLKKYRFEIVFTDNHSNDASFEIIRDICKSDKSVKVARFSKNFGYQKSILTGYLLSRGEASIQLDCDLQDPPELIVKFLENWEQGFKVVYGIRKSRKESFIIHLMRKLFYRLIRKISNDDLPVDAGDFRLIDRVIINELSKKRDNQIYLRGEIARMGFKQKGIEYNRNERDMGNSKFNFGSLIKFAINGILNHSNIPLRIATYFGIMISIISVLGIIVFFIGRLINYNWPAGFATLVILQIFSIGLNAIFLGIIGEYIIRINKNIKDSPCTILEDYTNLTKDQIKGVFNQDRNEY